MKFRKKPVEVDAIQWDGSNTVALSEFTGIPLDKICAAPFSNCLRISTLEGHMLADKGDWIIKGVEGEFYPCKPRIFAATYDRVGFSARPAE